MNTTTHDLGNGWFANWTRAEPGIGHGGKTATYATNEVMTIRNPDKGLRIDLPAESLATLRRIFATAEKEG